MRLVYALRHERVLHSSVVCCCCVNVPRPIYTLTCKMLWQEYVVKGAIILISLLRPGFFSNIGKR